MAKLRKMLCDITSPECAALMSQIETQSKATLACWAIGYARDRYLDIYEKECPGDTRLRDTIASCEQCLEGSIKLSELKPQLRDTAQTARDLNDYPVAQAAARAVSTACAAIQTPTNALGFLFYGAAAVAYSQAGLDKPAEVYDHMASQEFERALASLKQASVPDEAHPAKIQWNC